MEGSEGARRLRVTKPPPETNQQHKVLKMVTRILGTPLGPSERGIHPFSVIYGSV